MQFFIGGFQLFIGGLQLFIGSLEFFVGRLQFFISRLQLFVGRLQLFAGGLQFFYCRLQALFKGHIITVNNRATALAAIVENGANVDFQQAVFSSHSNVGLKTCRFIFWPRALQVLHELWAAVEQVGILHSPA